MPEPTDLHPAETDEIEPCQFDLTTVKDPIHLYAELRNRGYAVVMFTPHELHGVPPRPVQDRMTEVGWEIIGELKPGDWCPDCDPEQPT